MALKGFPKIPRTVCGPERGSAGNRQPRTTCAHRWHDRVQLPHDRTVISALNLGARLGVAGCVIPGCRSAKPDRHPKVSKQMTIGRRRRRRIENTLNPAHNLFPIGDISQTLGALGMNSKCEMGGLSERFCRGPKLIQVGIYNPNQKGPNPKLSTPEGGSSSGWRIWNALKKTAD